MLIILIRTIILYMAVLFVIRIMGKAELSKLDPFQMVILFMIAELAAIPIESSDVSVLNGVTAIVTLLFLEVLLSFISTKSHKVSDFLSGKPSILIDHGSVNTEELKNLRITIDDLMEQLRLKNYPSVSDVDFAVLESNGDLSVIPKPEKAPPTLDDLDVDTKSRLMPMVLISDGTLYRGNLERLQKDENYLKNELEKMHIHDYSQVFMCFYDENGKIHVYPRGKKSMESEKEANQH
ncbi:DUF421 domain-containing protein [Sinanaerobacter chloroacetimidivorans]|uniref:DUF421 domain-containing protein n=1 Tax=Sinanaerobacter chloroacetimidivorans TaxID=2818044 RepID=A0A8J7W514_9FIRM|nr:DUF421 domain-containing protein [Sinanaerobacter chloroacetimidivorans]MBR0600426.1 DUF421 domain-containing protein [Sinanaerobacter chloroacetimidivorans]